MPPSGTLTGMKDGDAFLLTHNPDHWEMDKDLLFEQIDATAHGRRVVARWSTGGRRSAIRAGDRAFLLRQGRGDRGICASGHFTSEVYEDDHWDGTDRLANYADLEWDVVLDPGDVLPTEVLQAELPDAHWTPQGSGSRIPSVILPALEDLWEAHVREVHGMQATHDVLIASRAPAQKDTVTSRGQGRRMDARLRRQIEDLAQQRLTDLFVSDGWSVEDMRYGNPFDARATRGDETVYLEAKGTTTAGRSVLVTRGEVDFAREHAGSCVMGVVTGIETISESEVDPDSGVLTLYEWVGDEDALVPVTYEFFLPNLAAN